MGRNLKKSVSLHLNNNNENSAVTRSLSNAKLLADESLKQPLQVQLFTDCVGGYYLFGVVVFFPFHFLCRLRCLFFWQIEFIISLFSFFFLFIVIRRRDIILLQVEFIRIFFFCRTAQIVFFRVCFQLWFRYSVARFPNSKISLQKMNFKSRPWVIWNKNGKKGIHQKWKESLKIRPMNVIYIRHTAM